MSGGIERGEGEAVGRVGERSVQGVYVSSILQSVVKYTCHYH